MSLSGEEPKERLGMVQTVLVAQQPQAPVLVSSSILHQIYYTCQSTSGMFRQLFSRLVLARRELDSQGLLILHVTPRRTKTDGQRGSHSRRGGRSCHACHALASHRRYVFQCMRVHFFRVYALTGVSGQGSCNFCDPGPSQLIFGLGSSFVEHGGRMKKNSCDDRRHATP